MYDIIIVALYLLINIILGWFTKKNIHTFQDFSVGNKTYSDKVMTATLFATVIGGGSTLGIATNVYQYGIIFMIAFYGAAINKFIVARFIAIRMGNYKTENSIGDIFQKHYGKIGRQLAGIFIIFVSIFCGGQQISALGFIFEYFFQIPFYLGVFIAYGVVVIYSAFGGIRAVVATDIFQFVIIIAFVPILFISSYSYIGSLSEIITLIPFEKIDIMQQKESWGKALTLFTIMTFSALDPAFIHRLIMAKTPQQAAYITKVTGYLSIPLFTLMGGIGLLTCAYNPHIESNLALPYMIDTIFPPIIRGFSITALLAIFMSTIDSSLHVVSLSMAQDIILPLRKKQTPHLKQIHIARLSTIFMGAISVCIALYFQNIFDIMIFSFSFWGPTILTPFVFMLYEKIFQKKELIIGIILGSVTVIFWNIFIKKNTGLDGFIPGVIINSLYFATRCTKKTK